MKRTLLLFTLSLSILTSACSDDGLSVDEFCAQIMTCPNPGYSSTSDCITKINSEVRRFPDCNEQINTYYECAGNLACGLGGVTSCKQEDTQLYICESKATNP